MWVALVIAAALAPVVADTEVVVRALDYSFEPARITAMGGADTILVMNGGKEPHTFTHDKPPGERAFETDAIAPGSSAEVQSPEEGGEYPFLCVFHPEMRGTLVVLPPSTTTTTTTPPTDADVDANADADAPGASWLAVAGILVALALVRKRA